MQDAWRILHAAGAELVLASYDHDYERFAPQDADGNRDARMGIRQFGIGTGGATVTPLPIRKFQCELGKHTSVGVLKLHLRVPGYEWEFLPVEKDGITDHGAALCHQEFFLALECVPACRITGTNQNRENRESRHEQTHDGIDAPVFCAMAG